MNKRYVDLDEILLALPKNAEIIIRDWPVADVAPVKHGEWIHERIKSAESSTGFFFSATCECSLCHTFVQQESNYCPNCGAKMEVDE